MHKRSPYDSAGWRAVRLFVLERDNYRCRLNYKGCTGVADSADHIKTVQDGGALLDPFNLRAACMHCNIVRGNKTRHTAKATAPAHLGPSREW